MTRFILLLLTFSLLLSCNSKKEKQAQQEKILSVPAPDEIVMYEIFVRNFTAEGTFNAIIPHLNRLKAMGVNVIWLMPIQPYGIEKKKGTYGSPYSIRDYKDVHPDHGTKADFKKLVDSIHAKGMYVIIDHVANHTAWDNAWMQHPEWYTRDSAGTIIPPVPDWSDVADLNFDNPDMRKAMIDAMKYWVDSFNIDGYRCDAAMMVPDDFWKGALDTLKKIRPLIFLAEAEDANDYYDGFQANYGWDMYHTVKGVFNGRPPAAIDSCLKREQSKFPSNYHAMRFVTNHDENSWDDVLQVKFTNMDGAKAAFTAMMSLPGIPFVYNGQEVGYPTRINLFEKYSIDWSANAELQNWYGTMLNYFRSSDVLRKGTLDQFDTLSKDVVIFRRSLDGKELWTVVNVRNAESKAAIPASLKGKKLKDAITGAELISEGEWKLMSFESHIIEVK